MRHLRWLARFARDTQGQDLIEYALVVGFVCFVAFVGVTHVSAGVSSAYLNINLGIQPLTSSSPSNSDEGYRIDNTGSVSTDIPCRAGTDHATRRCGDQPSAK